MRELLSAIRENPYMAHKGYIAQHGFRGLLSFVREMAMKHKIRLMVLPTWKTESDKWRSLAGIMLSEVVEGPHDGIYDPQDPKGKFEMPFGFRSASICLRGHTRYIRGGCLVRIDKASTKETYAWKNLIRQYNKDIKKGGIRAGMEFQSISEWLDEHPRALEIWRQTLAKRETVK